MPAKGVRFHRPQTSAELAQQARTFAYDTHRSLQYWLRYAEALKTQADGYARHGEEQYAYLLYERCRVLVLEMLPNHPDLRGGAGGASPKDKQALGRARVAASELGPLVARLGPSIDRRARHFSDAGKGVEVQTATETGMPAPGKGKRPRRKPRPMQQVADAFGIPRNHY